MSEGNQKINAFQVTVQKEVENEINVLINRAEQESEQIISRVKDESLNNSFYQISRETKLIKTACKKSVSKRSFESRRNILGKRSELVDRFFSEIEKKLSEFSSGDKYKGYIKAELKRIETIMPFYDGVRIYVKPQDTSDLSMFGDYAEKVVPETGIKLGGVAVYYPNERVYIDRTIDKRLRNERESFINHKEIQL